MALYELSDEQAEAVFATLAWKQLPKCECEHDTGYRCEHCDRLNAIVHRGRDIDDVLSRWGRMIAAKARLKEKEQG